MQCLCQIWDSSALLLSLTYLSLSVATVLTLKPSSHLSESHSLLRSSRMLGPLHLDCAEWTGLLSWYFSTQHSWLVPGCFQLWSRTQLNCVLAMWPWARTWTFTIWSPFPALSLRFNFYFCVCLYACALTRGCCQGPKEYPAFLQEVVSSPAWMLGIELWCFGWATSVLNHWAIF